MGHVRRLDHKSFDYQELQMLQRLCTVYSYTQVAKD